MMYNKHNALLIFASNWKEFFLVLTNLGLFVFKEAGNMENNKLIPINKDANLIMVNIKGVLPLYLHSTLPHLKKTFL
jgi:hypothetical protein